MGDFVVQVWISYAQFEASIEEYERARAVFEKGTQVLKTESQSHDERAMLLESWKEFEDEHGTAVTREVVSKRMPRRVKRRRQIKDENDVSSHLPLILFGV